MEIKKLVNDEKYIIVPDTNVLLNLYRYSPDFSEFGLQCLTEVVESLYWNTPKSERMTMSTSHLWICCFVPWNVKSRKV